jgi:putative cell wall-binding protein
MGADGVAAVRPGKGRWSRRLRAAVAGLVLTSSAGAALVPVLAAGAADPGMTVSATLDPSSSQPLDTGIDVTPGQRLFGGATGEAQYGLDACHGTTVEEVTVDPDGFRTDAGGAPCDVSAKVDPGAVDGSDPVGALIGRIGDSSWFMLGSGGPIPITSSGRLVVAFNDTPGGYGDNHGSYTGLFLMPFDVPGTAGGDGTVNGSGIANVAGVATGLNVSQGETVGVSADGAASYGFEGQDGCSGEAFTDPAGNRNVGGVPCSPAQKTVTPSDPTVPVPDAPIGALIGEIGSGPWFLIGGTASFVADASGPLSLGYNDPTAADNDGSFFVELTPGNFTPSGGTTGGGTTGASDGAPPVETGAVWLSSDSTGSHSLRITGTGLSAVTTVIYGAVPTTALPPACGEIEGVLAPTPGPCTYSVPPSEHRSDAQLEPTAPPHADLSHITLLSPWGRSDTFSLANPPVQPVLTGSDGSDGQPRGGVAVVGLRDPGTGAGAYPTEIELFGTGLSDVSDVIFGPIAFPAAPLACPASSDQPAGETCAYSVQAADHPAGAQDTELQVPVPIGADLSHVTVFGPGGGSNPVSVANEPGIPVVTTASAVFNGDGSGNFQATGSNLSGVTTALLGQPENGLMPNLCPFDIHGYLPINDNLPCVARPDNAFVEVLDGGTRVLVNFPPGVKTPSGGLGNLAHVVLLSPHGSSNAFAVTVPPAPTISSVAPDGTAPDGRPNLLFTGTDLGQATSVDFGSHPSPSFRAVSDTQVVAELPSGTGSVQAQVNTLGGPSNTLTITFPAFGTWSYAAPTASTGNPFLTITGSGITNASGPPPQVFFSNIPSPQVTVSGSTVQAEVPNLPRGYPHSVYVVVRTQTGDTPNVGACPGTGADCFAYPAPDTSHSWAGEFGPPHVNGVDPTHVSQSSLSTSLSGNGYQGASSVMVGTTKLPACPASGGCFAAVSDGQVRITAPALAPGGYPVTVTNPAGTSNAATLVFDAPPGVTGGNTVTPVSAPPGATGTATSGSNLPGAGFHFGPFTATGSWNQNGGVFSATGTVTLNGFLIEPDTGVTISFDTSTLLLTTTGQVTVSLAPVSVPGVGEVGPFVLYHKQVSWTLSAATLIDDLSSVHIGGLPIQSLSIKWPQVTNNGGANNNGPASGGSAVAVTTKLPGLLGGQPFTFSLGLTSIGVDPSTLHPCLGPVSLGELITVNGACISYDPGSDSWFLSGNAQAAGGTQITGSLTFTDGAVSQGKVVAKSTSLAGLIGVTGLELDYSATGASEEWQGKATDTGGHQSTFDFQFSNGALSVGTVNVPQASIGGVVTISNLKFSYQNGNWSLTSDAAANGVASATGSLVAAGGVVTSAEVTVNSPALGALVSFPSFHLAYDGSQPGTDKWSASATDNSGNVDSLSFTTVNGVLTSGSLSIPQASIAGFVTVSGVSLSFDTGHWQGRATASLPGGSGGSVSFDVTYDTSGQLTAAHFELFNATISGVVNVKDLKIDYAPDSGTYTGVIDAVIPGAQFAIGGGVEFENNAFKMATLSVSGDIPIGGVVYLESGSVTLSVDPLVVSGSVGIAIGTPPVPGVPDLLSAQGTLTYSAADGQNPSKWHLGVKLSVLQKFELANATADLVNGNEFGMDVGLQLPPPGYNWPVSGNADLSGWATPSGFSLFAQAQITVLGWHPTATILANNQALQACGDTGIGIKAGFKYTWSGQFTPFFPSCDVSRPVRPFATARLARLLRANGDPATPSFTAAAGDTALAGSVPGEGGLPSFTLTDPDGNSVDIPATTPSGTLLDLGTSKVFVLEDAPDGLTDFIVSNPVAGTYTTTPDDGSLPLGAATQYAVTTAPTVSGSVAPGASGNTLSWSASNLNGGTVEFVQRGTSATTQTITTTTQASGTATFTPSDGPAGTRTVTAVITDANGVPVSQTDVATFDAPAPAVPGAPAGLALGAGGSELTWSAPAGDGGSPITAYKVFAGQSLLALTAPGELSTDISGVPAGTSLTVVATNAVGDGPASSALVRATGDDSSPVPGVSGTASSDPSGSKPGPGLPEVVTVVSPAGGPIQITKNAGGGNVPAGYVPLGAGATIAAPPSTADHPVMLTFSVAANLIPAGVTPDELTVVRDGLVAPPCAAGTTQSDLCIQSVTVKDGVATITVLSAHASSWQVVAATTDRIAGADRVATAIAVSNQAFPSGGAGGVVIARSDDYADALAGGPLAGARHAPLLITPGSALDPRVLAEVTRVAPPGATVDLLGGTGAMAPSVADAVTAAGFKVVRIVGADRYGTATAVADALGDPGTVFVATGDNFADALSASDAAVGRGAVLLSSGSTLPAATSGYLAAHRPGTVYAIGGPAAQALRTVATASLVGSTRYGTAVAVAQRFFPGAKAVGVASGVNFPDALAAAPMLGAAGEPLLLTDPSGPPTELKAYLASAGITQVHVFGGPAAVGYAPHATGIGTRAQAHGRSRTR